MVEEDMGEVEEVHKSISTIEIIFKICHIVIAIGYDNYGGSSSYGGGYGGGGAYGGGSSYGGYDR